MNSINLQGRYSRSTAAVTAVLQHTQSNTHTGDTNSCLADRVKHSNKCWSIKPLSVSPGRWWSSEFEGLKKTFVCLMSCVSSQMRLRWPFNGLLSIRGSRRGTIGPLGQEEEQQGWREEAKARMERWGGREAEVRKIQCKATVNGQPET